MGRINKGFRLQMDTSPSETQGIDNPEALQHLFCGKGYWARAVGQGLLGKMEAHAGVAGNRMLALTVLDCIKATQNSSRLAARLLAGRNLEHPNKGPLISRLDGDPVIASTGTLWCGEWAGGANRSTTSGSRRGPYPSGNSCTKGSQSSAG